MIRPWKSDEAFLSRFQRIKTENKVEFVEQIIVCLTSTQYIKVPNPGFIPGASAFSEQFITQKRTVIDDVNSFFSKFLDDTRQGQPLRKDEDLMIHYMGIEEELSRSKDDQLRKLLTFTFAVTNLLIKSISTQKEEEGKAGHRKTLFVISIPATLDPALKLYLNSLKTMLLVRSLSLRLVIFDGDRIVAGQDSKGKKSEVA